MYRHNDREAFRHSVALYGGGYQSLKRLSGGFDIQVDYELVNWPANNGVRTGMNVITNEGGWVASVQRTTLGASETLSGNDIYCADYGSNGSASVTTADASGRLSMTRQ